MPQEAPLSNQPTTPLAGGAINQSGDTLEVVLVQPADNPNVIMIRWARRANDHNTRPLQRGGQHGDAAAGRGIPALARIKASNRL
jgi:hypothetical protein